MGLNSIRLTALGGFGVADPPAFLFDLSGAGIWDQAKKSGIQRYGKTSTSGADKRPVAPEFYHIFNPAWNDRSRWSPTNTAQASFLQAVGSPFGGKEGLSFTSTKTDDPGSFVLNAGLGENESVGMEGTVFEVDGDGEQVKGHIWFARISEGGVGAIFQLRDGNPEFARLSADWNENDETALRLLWALDEPTAAENTEIDRLKNLIYSGFESLSLENTTGRDSFSGTPFKISIIPDPYGAVHIVLGSNDAIRLEKPTTIKSNMLWPASSQIEVGQTGGAWMLQLLGVRFREGFLAYGPYQLAAAGRQTFTALAASQKDSSGDSIGTIEFKPFNSHTGEEVTDDSGEDEDETPYDFKALFASSDSRYGAWLYGLASESDAGPRTGLAESEALESSPPFDSDDLTNVPSYVKPDHKPVLEADVSCDESGCRSLTVTMRDVNGRTLQTVNGGIDGLVNRMANVTRGGNAFFTQAIIARGRLNGPKRAAYPAGFNPSRLPIYVSKGDTDVELELADGQRLLSEIPCTPPIISDGRRLGAAVRQRLRRAGYSDAEMARVPVNIGGTIPKAGPGEDWASVTSPDDDLLSSIEALLDRFGLGLRFYQDQNGVWVLEPRPSAILTHFTSSGSLNDPKLRHGGTRAIIKGEGFAWDRDHADFYNIFRVEGGENGELVREYVNEYSMHLYNGEVHPQWLGRPRRYPTLRDPGLKTMGDVLYALRSLNDRYGRPGRKLDFESYFDREYVPFDLVTMDGIISEVVSWEAHTATDEMFMRVREVV